MIEGAGVELAVVDGGGTGMPVVVVCDLAQRATSVGPLCVELADLGLRAVTYDRRGYGGSGAPEGYVATTVHEQAEDAAAVLRATGTEPALVVGLGFGALIALDVLIRHGGLVRAAVLVDAPVFAYVPEANEPLSAERLALEERLRSAGPRSACAAWGADPDDAHAFLADYAGRASWSPSPRQLRAIEVPVRVVSSDEAPEHVARAARALLDHLPAARAAPGVIDAARSLL